jgi:hypothetical protein
LFFWWLFWTLYFYIVKIFVKILVYSYILIKFLFNKFRKIKKRNY